jgi:hypothetical protein
MAATPASRNFFMARLSDAWTVVMGPVLPAGMFLNCGEKPQSSHYPDRCCTFTTK